MRPAKSPSSLAKMRAGLALVALLGFAPAVFAQVPPPQNLTIGFSSLNAAAVPLSGWLPAGIAAMLAAAGLVVLRRRTMHGGRLPGWVLVLVSGTTLALATGQRVISEAEALVGPTVITLNLSVSPASLNVAPFAPAFLNVVVTNITSQSVRIDSITLGSGTYALAASTCVVASVMAPGAQCTISLGVPA
ncbi:MAG: hypothetical protein KGJ25_08045 [Betaproteobacteria bacterium]|nr:hypothetical protein [Betaproteobacteria bacterium]